jgi:uncharacterized delta-60 repeat protein
MIRPCPTLTSLSATSRAQRNERPREGTDGAQLRNRANHRGLVIVSTTTDSVTGEAFEQIRWFPLPGEALERLRGSHAARYLPDGTLDPTFGSGGTVVGGIGTNEVRGITIAPNGTILIAGSRGGPKGLDVIVASYSPNGSLNTGFGQTGVAQADLSGGTDLGDDLVVKPNDDIVLVGSASSNTVSDMALVRFKPDGTLDTFLAADLSGFGDFGHALAIDSQGRIVAAGSAGGFGLMRALL